MAAGGFKMSLGGLKTKPGLKGAGLKNSSAQSGLKPKKALLGDDEPEDTNQAQEIAAFDAAQGGAIDINGPAEKKGPLVIPSLPNRNWREEARKRQLEKAPHTKQKSEDVVMEEPEKEVVYGLSVPTEPTAGEEPREATAEAMDIDVKAGDAEPLTDAQRLENAALEHLLNGKTTDTQRVVPAITDEQALANDLLDAPDEPDLDAYEATPIEGFGLAMLRGMGWKDSDGESRAGQKTSSKAPKEIKRRPALLGIGAKEDAAKDVELGEFNSKARPKKGQKDAPAGYNPVTLRNKKTGEVISEEDLKRKLESQEMLGEEERRAEPKEKETRRRDDEHDSDRRRSRRDDRERDRRGDEYDSERRRDRDRKDDRRRDKYDDDEGDRRREKRRARSRSRSPRDDRRRDRHRSRSRDAKDRRSRRDRSRSRDDEDRRRRRKERDYDDERDERRRREKRDKDDRSSRR